MVLDDPTISKEQSLKDPAHMIANVVQDVMLVGSKKDGRDSSWRRRSGLFHLSKAIRHGMTQLMIDQGIVEPDGEDHGKLMATRIAMYLTVRRNAKGT